MPKSSSLTTEEFDRFLKWLDADREQAGRRYWQMHQRLTKLFALKQCLRPEDLVDEVMDRVARNIHNYTGVDSDSCLKIFHAFAKYVYLEYCREQPILVLDEPLAAPVPTEIAPSDCEVEKQLWCLDQCLNE